VEIGLFQIENLLYAQTRFLFLDLRREKTKVGPALEAVFAKAIPLAATAVENYLVQEKTPLPSPVVLVCEDGQTSQGVAARLEKLGYLNVYVVERGIEGLLSDL